MDGILINVNIWKAYLFNKFPILHNHAYNTSQYLYQLTTLQQCKGLLQCAFLNQHNMQIILQYLFFCIMHGSLLVISCKTLSLMYKICSPTPYNAQKCAATIVSEVCIGHVRSGQSRKKDRNIS
jgi:hypothetical protein